MNRTEAIAEIEQLIEWTLATVFEGRCPRCEAMTYSDESIMLATRHPGGEGDRHIRDGERVAHAQDCPVLGMQDHALSLAQRFGLELLYGSERRGEMSYFGPLAVIKKGDPRPPNMFTVGEMED